MALSKIDTAAIATDAIEAAQLKSDAIAVGDLPTGTVLQTVRHEWSNQTIVTSQSLTLLSGSGKTVTTQAANSKFAIWVQGMAYRSDSGNNGFGVALYRGSTRIQSPYSNWSAGSAHGPGNSGAVSSAYHLVMLDTPNVAAGTSLDYNLYGIMHTSGQTVYFNYAGSWSGLVNASNMIIQEIAG